MRWLLVLLVACSRHGEPAPRTKDELLAQLAAAAAGSAADVRPPTEQELKWITDWSDHAPIVHLKDANRALRTSITLAHHSGPWAIAAVNIGADIADVLVDEAKRTAPDPLLDSIIQDTSELTLELANVQLARPTYRASDRIALAHAYRGHVDSFRKIWAQGDCDKLAGGLAIAILGEHDKDVTAALKELAGDLHDCKGIAR